VTPAPPTAAPRAATASLLVALAACCFGSISILTVVATRQGTSLTTLLFWRFALASVVLLPIAWRSVTPALPAPRGRRALHGLLVAGVGQAAVTFLSLSALRWIPAATLGFLFYTFPAWVTLFAAVRGTERVDARRVLALALSLGGIVLTVGAPAAGGAAVVWPGVALALAAALVYAVYVGYLGRLQTTMTPQYAALYMTVGAGILFAIGAAADGTLTVRLPATSWWVALTLALACTVLAFLAFLRGLSGLGPVRASIVATVEPFWTAVLGAAVLGQRLTPATLGGGAMIAAAVLLLQLPPSAAGAGTAERASPDRAA
jgi:drug/metabolite transporter (DMT)-like permease